MAATDPSESIIWEGRRPLPKTLTLSLILFLFVLAGVSAVGYLGDFRNAATVDVIVLVLILVGMIFVGVDRGLHFYITNRRILRTWDFLRWKRRWELPLQSLAEVVVKRNRGKSLILFVGSPGHRGIAFGPVREDPERIREIAVRAKSALASG